MKYACRHCIPTWTTYTETPAVEKRCYMFVGQIKYRTCEQHKFKFGAYRRGNINTFFAAQVRQVTLVEVKIKISRERKNNQSDDYISYTTRRNRQDSQ